jgi:hypothetical protein
MAAKPRKSRPNEIEMDLSDDTSYGVLEAKRTRGRRRAMNDGYARTSTIDQAAGLAAQERDLKAAGAERIFGEQVSSTAKRTKLAECLAFLREGDVLTVTKPDRLARSTAELLSIEADLSKRGIGLVVLSMGGERLDTRNPTSKLMLTILAGVATWEREIMLERQREGEGRRQIQGPTRQHRRGADQATACRVGSRGDCQEARHRSEFGLPRVGGIAARQSIRMTGHIPPASAVRVESYSSP